MKNRQQKSRASTLINSRKIVANDNLNPNGTLFGGDLMAWIDEVAFMCARRFTGRPTCVTASIDNISFKAPLRLGDHIFFSAVVNHAGQSSMQIEVLVEREDAETHEKSLTNSAYLTFVCLGSDWKPTAVPKLLLEDPMDHISNQDAVLRTKARKRLEGFIVRRRAALTRRLDTIKKDPPTSRQNITATLEKSFVKFVNIQEKNLASWIARLEKSIM